MFYSCGGHFDQSIMELLIDNKSVWEVYPIVLPLFAICLPIDAVAFKLDSVFKGMGKAKFLRSVFFISTIGGFLPVLLIGHYYSPGLEIVWWAIIAWMVLRSIITFFYFRLWIGKYQ